MKIGILTLPLHTNYGGILQAYALQTVLERMGHEVVIFNTPCRYPKTNLKLLFKRLIKKMLYDDVVMFWEKRLKKEAPVIFKDVWAFRSKYLHEYVIESLNDIHEDDVDAIVVGSDQVWRPMYFKSMWLANMDDAFLAFTKGWNICRLAYAASLGVDYWEMNQDDTYASKNAISVFDAVSVREDSGICLLSEYLDVDSVKVLDPTLLLDREDYLRLVDKSLEFKEKGNLLVYILNSSKAKDTFIKKVSEERNLIPFSVNNSMTRNTAPIEERVLPSVESWLKGFADAEFVITDSFHACVFSIIFHKPFVAIGNDERGMSRFESLLKMFHLENHLIRTLDGYDASFDYGIPDNIDRLIDGMREVSMQFLERLNNKK